MRFFYWVVVGDAGFSSDWLSMPGAAQQPLTFFASPKKVSKERRRKAVARCAGTQVKQSPAGSTNKLAFGSNRFALFIRLTITCLGNVTCGHFKTNSKPNSNFNSIAHSRDVRDFRQSTRLELLTYPCTNGDPKGSGSAVAFFCLLFLAKQEK